LPETKKESELEIPLRDYQMYITAKSIEDFHKANKNVKLNVSGQDERELEAALKKSMAENGEGEEE
jgi:phosphotransferase system HPr-like phosphotransfer protein